VLNRQLTPQGVCANLLERDFQAPEAGNQVGDRHQRDQDPGRPSCILCVVLTCLDQTHCWAGPCITGRTGQMVIQGRVIGGLAASGAASADPASDRGSQFS